MSSTRADHGISGSLAGLRLCMVMHVGNSGGLRMWQGLLGRRPDWGIGPPWSTGVRKGSAETLEQSQDATSPYRSAFRIL
jgi:hypothetical protein